MYYLLLDNINRHVKYYHIHYSDSELRLLTDYCITDRYLCLFNQLGLFYFSNKAIRFHWYFVTLNNLTFKTESPNMTYCHMTMCHIVRKESNHA